MTIFWIAFGIIIIVAGYVTYATVDGGRGKYGGMF